MEAGITELGTTFFVGAFLVLAIWLILHVLYGVCGFPKAEQERSRPVGLLIVLSSVGLGVIAENASDRFVNSWRVYERFASPLFPTDTQLKVEALFERDEKNPEELNPTPLALSMAEKGIFSVHGGEAGRQVEQWVLQSKKSRLAAPPTLEDAVLAVYYVAKNRVYGVETYFAELSRIEHRIDFARSCTFLADVLIVFLGVALVIRILPGVSLAPSDHILRKRRVAGLGLCLSMLHVLCVAAYAKEETQFNKRAFGYFTTMRGSALRVEVSTVIPGMSGMAHWRRRIPGYEEFIVVHDGKVPDPSPRIGLLRVVPDLPPSYAPIDINDWRDSDGPANDLEAICSVPGEPDQFLLLESSYFGKERFGRIFRLGVREVEGAMKGEILGVTRLPDSDDLFDTDAEGRDRYAYNFEGMAALWWNDRLLLLLGHRGGASPSEPGRLFVAVPEGSLLGVPSECLRIEEVGPLVAPLPESGARGDFRHCTDLHVQMVGDHAGVLWCASAEDLGQNGPFRSSVYAIGRIDLLARDATGVAVLEPRDAGAAPPKERWILDGIKVEALARSAADAFGLSIGSDDEVYGGIWRPLSPRLDKTKDQVSSGHPMMRSVGESQTRRR